MFRKFQFKIQRQKEKIPDCEKVSIMINSSPAPPISATNPKYLSKAEQFRLKRKQEQEEQQQQQPQQQYNQYHQHPSPGIGNSNGNSPQQHPQQPFFDKFGHQERTGMGRISMVVAPATTSSTNDDNNYNTNDVINSSQMVNRPPLPPQMTTMNNNVNFQQQQQQQQQQNRTSGLSSPLTLKKGVTTLEAKDLQRQLESIREMRETEAVFAGSVSSNPYFSNNTTMLQRGGNNSNRSTANPSPFSQHQGINNNNNNNSNTNKIECACCGKVVPKSVVSYVPRDSLLVVANTAVSAKNNKKGPLKSVRK